MNDPKASSQPLPIATDHAQWFSEKVYAHAPSLKAYLRASYPQLRDAEDVVQESFFRVWRVGRVQPIASAKAFLFTIARRLALDWLRHDRRSPIETVGALDALHVLDEKPGVADVVSRREKIALLIDAIDSLPGRCRDVVILHKIKLLSAREVAERLGISEKGVEVQVHRGVQRVRAYLERRGVRGLIDSES